MDERNSEPAAIVLSSRNTSTLETIFISKIFLIGDFFSNWQICASFKEDYFYFIQLLS